MLWVAFETVILKDGKGKALKDKLPVKSNFPVPIIL